MACGHSGVFGWCRRCSGRHGARIHLFHHVKMDATADRRFHLQSGNQLSRDGGRNGRRRPVGRLANFADATGARRIMAGHPILSQCSVAGIALLRHVFAALPDENFRLGYPPARLDQGHLRPVLAGDGQRFGDRPRCHSIDPVRAMGIVGIACLQPAADAVDDYPAAVCEAHAAAVDEPVCHFDHGLSWPRSSASPR